VPSAVAQPSVTGAACAAESVSVTVAVEQGTLQVYKAGIIYFAALARPDTTLPLAALNLIARELSRHTK